MDTNHVYRLSFFTILFLFSTILNAQTGVIIKERVEIALVKSFTHVTGSWWDWTWDNWAKDSVAYDSSAQEIIEIVDGPDNGYSPTQIIMYDGQSLGFDPYGGGSTSSIFTYDQSTAIYTYKPKTLLTGFEVSIFSPDSLNYYNSYCLVYYNDLLIAYTSLGYYINPESGFTYPGGTSLYGYPGEIFLSIKGIPPPPPCVSVLCISIPVIQDIQYGSATDIYSSVIDVRCGGGYSGGTDTYLKYELSGDAGILRDLNTGRTSTLIDSISSLTGKHVQVLDSVKFLTVEFDAYGNEPNLRDTMSLKISSDDGSILPSEELFYVIPPLPPQIIVIPAKSVLYYGDTTALISNIPSDWYTNYNVAVQEDEYGNVYSGSLGGYIGGYNLQPYFLSYPDTVDDSVEVFIQISAMEPCPDCLPCSVNPKDTTVVLPPKTNLSVKTNQRFKNFSEAQAYVQAMEMKKKQSQMKKNAMSKNNSGKKVMHTTGEGDWHYTFVRLVLKKPPHLELWSNPSTICYGDTVNVAIVPVGIDSLFAPLGPDQDHEFSIAFTGKTSHYGQLLYNGQSGTSFNHIPSVGGQGVGVQFAANGREPDSTVSLTFELKEKYIGKGITGSAGTTQAKTMSTIRNIASERNIMPKGKSAIQWLARSATASQAKISVVGNIANKQNVLSKNTNDIQEKKKLKETITVMITGCPSHSISIENKDTTSEVKPKLNIKDHSPWTIWPYLPPQNNAPHNRGADMPGYNPKRTFEIQLKDGSGNPLPNQQISIFTKYEKDSGGHGHTGWADTAAGAPRAIKSMSNSLQGVFYYKGGKVGQNPLTVTTDAKGEAKIDSFISSQASGKFLVTARMVRDTTIMDTVNLQVKVDGLVNFGIGNYWNLTGNTSKVGINHKRNHWCTRKMKDSLSAALKDFYNWSGSEEGKYQYIKLGINDMCLQWGGAFDFPGLWNFNDKHSFHRVGLSVDIDNTADGDIRYEDGTLTDKGEQLKVFMEKYGGQKYNLEKPIHFGFGGER